MTTYEALIAQMKANIAHTDRLIAACNDALGMVSA